MQKRYWRENNFTRQSNEMAMFKLFKFINAISFGETTKLDCWSCMCVRMFESVWVSVCIWNVALSRLSLSRGNGTWSERTQTNKWTGWQRSPTLCIEKLCWTEKCFLFSKTKVYGFCVGLKPFLGMRSKASVTSQNKKIYEFKWNWLAKEAKEEEEA